MSDLVVVSFRPERDQYAWTFGGAAPVMRIRTPAVLEVYTEDCFGGRVRSEQDLVSQVCEFPFLNPQTGPFYIEGAEPGDTVAVHFVSIEPARSWAASTTVPLFGALTSTHLTALLQDPLPEVVWLWQLDAAARTCRFSARRGSFKMDLPMERLESDTHIMSAGSARPLEDAFRIAQHDMVTWVAALCGLDPLDAYQLVTQAVESPLANVCDTNYTSIAKMPKRYLTPGVMQDAHARLRDLADEYRG